MGGFRLSIDYGTSHTVATLAGADGRTRQLLFDGSPLLSSAVADDGFGGLLTGAEALRAARTAPASVEPNPKRRVTDGDVLLGERSHPVVALIAATLRTVADEALRVAGSVPALTVTYPAGWGASRRGVLAAAVASSGFGTAAYVPEPVAAARFFTARADVPVGAHLVVYDLGAGTCDVAVLRRSANGFEVVGVGGLDDVGGLDLDAAVVDVLARAIGDTEEWRRLLGGESPRERHVLWREAREAKEALSRRSSALVHILGRDLPVSREDFEAAAQPVLKRTVALTGQVIASCGLTAADVAAVHLVGGASRVPLVATMLHRATGIAPTVLDQPELVVSEGAALPGEASPAVVPEPVSSPRMGDVTGEASPAVVPEPVSSPRMGDVVAHRRALTDLATRMRALLAVREAARQARPPAEPALPPGPAGEARFSFTRPQELRRRAMLNRTVRNVLLAAPVVIFAVPALSDSVIDGLLVGEFGLSPFGALVALATPWIPAGVVSSRIPRQLEACRVVVDGGGVTISRRGVTFTLRWDRVQRFGVEGGRFAIHAQRPIGMREEAPTDATVRYLLGGPGWSADAHRLPEAVRHFSAGRLG